MSTAMDARRWREIEDRRTRSSCLTCGNEVRLEEFAAPVNLTAFQTSGMCQDCQDQADH